MGCLVVRTAGFRRCEGTFHCRLADRARVIELMSAGGTFRGIVYSDGADIGRRRVDVVVRGFRMETDGIYLQIQATGEWWRAIEGPPSRHAL